MSKQLTKVSSITLYRVVPIQTLDGDNTDTLTNVGTYKVSKQELNDAVSASIYGADINKILRISSINNLLEILLKSKIVDAIDNISKYRLSFDDITYYKVNVVKSKYIDIERL